jgi:hypothetical protein
MDDDADCIDFNAFRKCSEIPTQVSQPLDNDPISKSDFEPLSLATMSPAIIYPSTAQCGSLPVSRLSSHDERNTPNLRSSTPPVMMQGSPSEIRRSAPHRRSSKTKYTSQWTYAKQPACQQKPSCRSIRSTSSRTPSVRTYKTGQTTVEIEEYTLDLSTYPRSDWKYLQRQASIPALRSRGPVRECKHHAHHGCRTSEHPSILMPSQ